MNKTHLILLIIYSTFFHTCENNVDPEILAVVGTSEVTADDFIESYSNKLINTAAQDSDFERSRTLNELIRTKLFAEAARSKNLSLDSIGLNRVKLSKELALREELYNHIIGSKGVAIEDSIARKHFTWKNTEISLKHIFHQDKEVLDTLLPLILKNSIMFDVYAKKLFKDKNLKDSGGDLGWISYNTLDPNLEQTAFSMPINKAVGPIRSSYGWHILLKKDERRQMIISENDYQNTKHGLINTIIKKQTQIMANDYVNNLMDNDITIDDTLVMNTLHKIHTIVFQKNKNEYDLKPKISEKLTEFIIDLKLNANTTLATFKNGSFTINDLLNNLRNSSPKSFLDNPVQAFYIALRNKLLTTEALNRGLQNNKKVQWKIQSKEDQYLAREFLLSLSKDKKQKNFSEKDIMEITKKLKAQYKIVVYDKSLEKLFKSKLKAN